MSISSDVGIAVGLIVICIGWLLQIIHSWNGRREIRKRTLIFYNLGVAILIINYVFVIKTTDAFITAFFCFIVLILSSLLLMRVSKSEVIENNNKIHHRVAKRKRRE
jgi:hypothetical protein